jgi:hypothetical protein
MPICRAGIIDGIDRPIKFLLGTRKQPSFELLLE